ncbi:MAG TPA: disulfide oxidoreductase, partial [Kiloniellales bacterium]|nr:disulfide oxidoreductase [Kiloniellales bacterium]
LVKFDGRLPRRLSAAEIGQIAGRAGRYMNDGTFGTTNDQGELSPELVEQVENHRFPPLEVLYWRSNELDFESPRALLASLEARPPNRYLKRAREADDQKSLAILADDGEILDRCRDRKAVRLLWEACQIPDFHRTMADHHARLVAQVFRHLQDDGGRLPEPWVAAQIQRIDRPGGDIDTLTQRLAQIRTWTYIAHRADWLDDPQHWQAKTRAVEDRLSDALHDSLTERFVDRRAAFFARRLAEGERLLAAIKGDGEVMVEGHPVGHLQGFHFLLDREITGEDRRAALTAARKALVEEIPRRVFALERDPDSAFRLDDSGSVHWREQPVARLAAGDTVLSPRIETLASDFLDGAQRERIRLRLTRWLEAHLERRLKPLVILSRATLPALSRGLAFQLVEALGCLARSEATTVAALKRPERKALTALGVSFGAESLYMPALFAPRATALRALLWSVKSGQPAPPRPAAAQQLSLHLAGLSPETFWRAVGYRHFERRGESVVIRADALERVAELARRLAQQGPFVLTPALEQAAGGDAETVAFLLGFLGFRAQEEEGIVSFEARGRAQPPARARRHGRDGGRQQRKPQADPASPFFKLNELRFRS